MTFRSRFLRGALRTLPLSIGIATTVQAQPSYYAVADYHIRFPAENELVIDLNADGKPELLEVGLGAVCAHTVDMPNGTVDTLGAFNDPSCFDLTSDLQETVAAADFNGDGKPDLALPNFHSASITVLLNASAAGGDIDFLPLQTFTAGAEPNGIAVADFNADGKPDIATANAEGSVSVLLNTTASGATQATFAAQTSFSAVPAALAIATADFNGDGKPDIAVAGGGMVAILLNTTSPGASTPSFTAPITAGAYTGSYLPNLAVADLDIDGRPDIAVPSAGGTVNVLLNTTPAHATQTTFITHPVTAPAVTNVYFVAAADLDGDGRADLAVVSNQDPGSHVTVLTNRSFHSIGFDGFDAQTFATGVNPGSITIGDLNQDGKPDIVTGDYGGADRVSWLGLLFNTTGRSFTNINQQGISGSWYNPLTSGQGLEIEVYPDLNGTGNGLLGGGWFTYGADAAEGRHWYAISANVSSTAPIARLDIFAKVEGNFDAPPVVSLNYPVGEATLEFTDCNHGTLHYVFPHAYVTGLFPSERSGVIPLTRLLPNRNCTSSGSSGSSPATARLSGNWYNPATSGQGLIFDVNADAHVLFAAWYTFALDGEHVPWGASQNWFTLQGPFTDASAPVHDIAIVESSGGAFDDPAPVSSVQVGSADIAFQSCSAMTLTYRFTGGGNAGRTGTIPLQRIGPTPTGCALQ